MFSKPGTRVLISEDCRPGKNAAGQRGTLLENKPFSVVFGYQPTPEHETDWKDGEYSYEDYKSGFIKMQNGEPAHKYYPEWEPGKEQPRPFFAMVCTNPYIQLDNGDFIWGAECWWGPDEDETVTLENAQISTEQTKDFLRALLEGIGEAEQKAGTNE